VEEVEEAIDPTQRRSGRRRSVVLTAPTWRRSEVPTSWRRSEAPVWRRSEAPTSWRRSEVLASWRRSEAPAWRCTWRTYRRAHGGGRT
jgi:hypothetical protein